VNIARALALLVLTWIGATKLSASDSNSAVSANELMRRIISNELKAEAQDHSHWMFRQETVKPGSGPELDDVVETRSGDLTFPISKNGRELSREQKTKVEQHIQQLVHNPGDLQKSWKAKNEDEARTQRLLKIFPQAFDFSYAEQHGDLVQLNFRPKPEFHPNSREAQVFYAMEGSVWVDRKQSRLSEMAGHLMHEVKFAGGFLGHLDKGGQFEVKQAEVAPGYWELTELNVQMRGKALFFKTISVKQRYSRSDLRLVPDNLTLEQAAQLLHNQVFATAKNERASRSQR
jgi:mannose-6-phosphate isomerase-like protein (cupin superfamily)